MKAYELISDEGKWTKHQYAMTEAGVSCAPYDKQAVRWCAVGAVVKCYEDQPLSKMLAQADRLCEKRYGARSHLAEVNDRFGREAAIEILKELDI